MKKIALTALALSVSVGSAIAADLPSRKATVLPPAPSMWTGFYAGLNAGGTWNNSSSINVATYSLNNWGRDYPVFLASPTLNGSLNSGSNAGFIGGGQIGYNWQIGNLGGLGFCSCLVTGIEADIQGFAGNSGTRSTNSLVPGPNNGVYEGAPFNSTFVESVWTNMTASGSLQYLGTVRGRLGFLANPALLIYGTGGLAYGGVSLNISQSQLYSSALANVSGPVWFAAGITNYSNTQVGYTAGGGIEWMFMPNWSVKAEYLYYNLGNLSVTSVMTGTPQGIWASNPPYRPAALWTTSTISSSISGNIVRAGVNYHFNWSAAPVVAKY